MNTPTLSSSQRMAFLAAFFPILDPAGIPRLEEQSADAKTLEDIVCAGLALDAMFRLRTQGDIRLSLWPRVWPWVEFIGTPRPLSRAFRDHPTTYALISETSGFWAHLVETWTFLAQLDSPYERLLVFDDLVWFLASSGVRTHPERLEEMVDAAGSIIRLAGVVADLLRTFLKHYTPEISQEPHQLTVKTSVHEFHVAVP
ncbi:hypothetical protein FB45DRAFT_1085475 [Roridomyces roridus]|uniref:Uncharacterized protein n=1 Tax=Roridomyces roridus TaxID=1738132 RepID=A0AAD7AXW8_9AGAR|nr:hypothetical protein FB45DRAFT_1085475 [Roridomyces roridus]